MMIAIFAIVSNLLAPEVFSQMQASAGAMPELEICHAAGYGASNIISQPAPLSDGAAQQHACCKVCVCHLTGSGLPSPPYLPTFFPASRAVLSESAPDGAAVTSFSTKSSPRGPPLFD